MAKHTDWACHAYGEEAPREWCFMEQVSICPSEVHCVLRMMVERRLLWARMDELARQGDETSRWLLTQFEGPWELLGGDSLRSWSLEPGPARDALQRREDSPPD